MTSTSKPICTLHESIKTLNLNTVQQAYKHDSSSLNTLDPAIGWSVLYKAVVYEHIEITKFLLTKGADPNLVNKIGETPLHYAVEIGRIEFVDILLRYGADPNLSQPDGNTPLHIACKKNWTDIIKVLLGYQVDVNAQNKLGRTPLYFVSNNCNVDIYEILLEQGADPDIKDKWGKKPFALITVDKKDLKPVAKIASKVVTPTTSEAVSKQKVQESENKENSQMQNSYKRIDLNKHGLRKEPEELATPLKTERSDVKKSDNTFRENVLEEITNIVSHSNYQDFPADLSRNSVSIQNEKQSSCSAKTTKREIINSIMAQQKLLRSSTKSNSKNLTSNQATKNQNEALSIVDKEENIRSKSGEAQYRKDKEHKLQNQQMQPARSLEETCLSESQPSKRSSIAPNSEVSPSRETTSWAQGEDVVRNSDIPPLSPDKSVEKAQHDHYSASPQPIENDPTVIEKQSASLHQEILESENNKEADLSTSSKRLDDVEMSCQEINNNLTNIFCHQSPEKPEPVAQQVELPNRKTLPVKQEEKFYSGPKMADWLAEIGLEDLKENFIDNGYTYQSRFKKDYEFSKTIFQDLIYRFGLDKLGHRCRITMKLREESGIFFRRGLFRYCWPNKSSNLDYPSIEEWLKTLGYEEYTDNFIDNGFDNLEYIILQTDFKEFPFDEFLLRDEIGISHKKIRDEIMGKLRCLYETASQIETTKLESTKAGGTSCSKDNIKGCSMF